MRETEWRGRKRIALDPGEYFATKEYGIVLTTLLGSCVAACLYDPVAKVIGMNHFLLSSRRYSRDEPMSHTDAGRYGIHSMELLINDMLKMGASTKNIHAKAFGGANVLNTAVSVKSNFFVVGEVNCRFVRDFLQKENIPLKAQDLGGNAGRVIHFFSEDYSVLVKRMQRTEESRLSKQEETFWKHSNESAPSTHTTSTTIWDTP